MNLKQAQGRYLQHVVGSRLLIYIHQAISLARLASEWSVRSTTIFEVLNHEGDK
jgi:hypothetical protein